MKLQVSRSLLSLIESCRSLKQLNQIHAKSIIAGLPYYQFILDKITHSFLSFESIIYAKCVLDQTQEPSIFSYNAMIKAYTQSETPSVVISIYNTMRVRQNLLGDKFTYPFVLKACACEFAVEKGREVHGVVLRLGYDSNRFLSNSLLSFYGVCGDMSSARQVFDEFREKDVVFWNAMITVCARNGMVVEGIQIFRQMVEEEAFRPNEVTVLVLISTCSASKNMKLGCEIHGYVRKDVNLHVDVKIGAALVDMYAKCGYLDKARKVFEEMPEKNSVVWNSLICGNSEKGRLHEAIDLFREMSISNVKPDKFTISCLLSTCAQMGAVNLGTWVWKYAKNNGLWDVFIETSLVDMYAKCGYIVTARELFDQMEKKTIVTWNAILSGYAINGQGESAMELFDHMRKLGLRPDSISFLSILHVCAHAGFVEEGRKYFDLMTKHYNLIPKVEHYGCMVDLLGRAGHLEEARELIERMDVEPTVIVWGALLNACSIHGDSKVGEWAAQHTSKSKAMDGGSYVLLSNLYAAGQRFDGVKEVREAMMEKGIYKPPGCSMIEIDDIVHEFVVADKVNPRSEEIYRVLEDLSRKLKMSGCMNLPVFDEGHLKLAEG